MAHYSPPWPTMAHYGPLWPTMAHDGPQWSTMAHYGPRCSTMAHDGPRWPTIAGRASVLWSNCRVILQPNPAKFYRRPSKTLGASAGPGGQSLCARTQRPLLCHASMLPFHVRALHIMVMVKQPYVRTGEVSNSLATFLTSLLSAELTERRVA